MTTSSKNKLCIQLDCHCCHERLMAYLDWTRDNGAPSIQQLDCFFAVGYPRYEAFDIQQLLIAVIKNMPTLEHVTFMNTCDFSTKDASINSFLDAVYQNESIHHTVMLDHIFCSALAAQKLFNWKIWRELDSCHIMGICPSAMDTPVMWKNWSLLVILQGWLILCHVCQYGHHLKQRNGLF